MNPRTSVTVTMDEYQKLSEGLPVGGVAFIACAAFGIGLVVGMSDVIVGDDTPTTRPTPTVTQPAVGVPGHVEVRPGSAVVVRI